MPRNGAYPVFVIAWKGVIRKMFRNLVLILAVALLVALLVFALLFNKAVKEDIKMATRKLGADIVIVPAEAKSMAEEFILESKEKSFYMDEFVFESLQDIPEIKAATYQVYLNTLQSGCCSIMEGQVVAFDQNKDFIVTPWLDHPKPLKEGEVYVGSYVYEYLGLIDTATLYGRGIKVVGHLERTGTGLDHGIFMRTEDLDLVTNKAIGGYQPGKISIIFLKLKPGSDPDKVVAEIRDINPRVGIMTRGNIGADVRTTLRDIIRVFTITIIISSILAILLAWSTFTAMANERQREVGILRAIGARRSHILRMFLAEAMIVSALGGVIGIGIGHYLILHLAKDFHLLTRLGAVGGVTHQSVLLSLVAMLSGIGVCLIGASIPILRLARMEPLLAIKEE